MTATSDRTAVLLIAHGSREPSANNDLLELAGRLASLRHYVGLHRTQERLVRLLGDFHFGTLSAALTAWRGLEPSQRAAA